MGIIAILLFLSAILLISILVILNSFSSWKKARQSLKMSAFFVSTAKSESTPENLKAFLSSLSDLKAKQWNNLIYGKPYITLEFVTNQPSGMVHFYLAAPAAYSETVRQNLQKIFPSAKILNAPDYNVLNPNGHHFAGSLKNGADSNHLSAAFNVVQELTDGEAGALQILLRPGREKFNANVRLLCSSYSQLRPQLISTRTQNGFSIAKGANLDRFVENYSMRLFEESKKTEIPVKNLAEVLSAILCAKKIF